MKIQANRLAYPVTTLGPGRRIALWVQGCSRHCEGCASRDTWDHAGGEALDIEDLADKITELIVLERLDGLSVTGGEPVEQAEALARLINIIRGRIDDERISRGFTVLVFTGFPYDQIESSYPALIGLVDVMVCGPYDETRPRSNRLVASDNQELIFLNEFAKEEFMSYALDETRLLQFDAKGSSISLIGMPLFGDLGNIEKSLAKRGVIFEEVSWRN